MSVVIDMEQGYYLKHILCKATSNIAESWNTMIWSKCTQTTTFSLFLSL